MLAFLALKGNLKMRDKELRDWFAGQAVSGILAAVTTKEVMDLYTASAKARGIEEEQYVAAMAYAVADALMAESEK